MKRDEIGEEKMAKHTEQTREEALSERLHFVLGHLMAAEALAHEDEAVHIQQAKSAVCRVLRELEPPPEDK